MRIDLPWIASVIIGVVVAGVVILLFAGNPLARLVPGRAPPLPAVPASPAANRPPTIPTLMPGGTPRSAGAAPADTATPAGRPFVPALDVTPPGGVEAYAAARALVARGRLREAQDEYLRLLALMPDDPEALRGLAAVRRRMARDDPALLRRQAAEYEEAAARGVETKEFYTPTAMRALARALLLAAAEVEREKGIASPEGALLERDVPAPAVSPRARRTPRPEPATPRPRRRVRQTPRPALTPIVLSAGPSPVRSITPGPSPAPTRAPTPPPPPDEREPFFLIQVGPIFNADRAAEIAAELTLAGYAARVSRPVGGNSYVVTLGPYRRSVAEAVVKSIRARYGAALPVALSPVP